MCRVMLYMGNQTVSLYDLLFAPDNSLIKQSYAPKLMRHIQNLAGFGMAGWNYSEDSPDAPYFYKTDMLPFFDKNLLNLAEKVKVNCLLSHVRGVGYDTSNKVGRENAHPFMFDGYPIALAHNGDIEGIGLMKQALLKYIDQEVAKRILGTTDSEIIYALFLSNLKKPKEKVELKEAKEALLKTFDIIKKIRVEMGLETSSPVNLFVTNGDFLIVTRFAFDFGRNLRNVQKAHMEYHSMWFTYGEEYGCFDGIYRIKGTKKRNNIIFSSEPLTDAKMSWVEMPEYTLTTTWFENEEIRFCTEDLDV